jgi:hypothetical protein
MKRILIYSIPAIFAGLVISITVQAQVASPNYFKSVNGNIVPINPSSTIGSSTVNGAFKNLTVSGTCTGCGGGSSSSSPSNFTVRGTNTSTITGDGSASFIPNLNTYHSFPNTTQLAAGFPCGAFIDTDAAKCLQDIYTADNGIASTTVVNGPFSNYSTINIVDANVAGHYIDFRGQGGNGTVWTYTASTTPSGTGIFTLNDCVSNSKAQVTQLENLSIMGTTATTTNGGVTGVYAGATSTGAGGNGGCATKINDLNIGTLAYGLVTATDTYWFSDSDLNIFNTFRCLWQKTGGNSGESIQHDNLHCNNPASLLINGLATSSKQVYLDTNSSPSTLFNSPAFDSDQYYQEPGNYVTIVSPHLEDSQNNIGSYERVYVSGTAQFGNLTVYGGNSTEDQTSTLAGGPINDIFNCGGVCSVNGMQALRNGNATTTTNFMVNSAGNSTAWETVQNVINGNSNTAFTNLLNGFIGTPNNGSSMTSLDNSWPMGIVYTTANQALFQDGGGTIGNFNPTGWNFGSGAPATTTVYVTGSFGGNANIQSSNQTLTATSAHIQISTNAGAVTSTLPTIASSQGEEFEFYNRGTTAWMITATSSDKMSLAGVNTGSTSSIPAGGTLELYNDGSFWDKMR